MKIWFSYGSEHSMKLVMIGQFTDIGNAQSAMEVIKLLRKQVEDDSQSGLLKFGEQTDRYTKGMLELLSKMNIMSIGPSEIEQFGYDVKTEIKTDQIVIKTDEADISAYFKVLLQNGARIEMFSTHDYPLDDDKKSH
jgi:hypothetical protein